MLNLNKLLQMPFVRYLFSCPLVFTGYIVAGLQWFSMLFYRMVACGIFVHILSFLFVVILYSFSSYTNHVVSCQEPMVTLNPNLLCVSLYFSILIDSLKSSSSSSNLDPITSLLWDKFHFSRSISGVSYYSEPSLIACSKVSHRYSVSNYSDIITLFHGFHYRYPITEANPSFFDLPSSISQIDRNLYSLFQYYFTNHPNVPHDVFPPHSPELCNNRNSILEYHFHMRHLSRELTALQYVSTIQDYDARSHFSNLSFNDFYCMSSRSPHIRYIYLLRSYEAGYAARQLS